MLAHLIEVHQDSEFDLSTFIYDFGKIIHKDATSTVYRNNSIQITLDKLSALQEKLADIGTTLEGIEEEHE